MARLLLVVLAAGLAATASAQGVVLDGRRCATPEPTVAETLESVRVVEAFEARAQDPLAPALRAGAAPVTVPLAVHVITGEGGRGDVSDERIRTQLDTLNAAFAPVGLRFALALVERVENPAWYADLRLGSAQEGDMMRQLARDPARTLNLYTASLALDYLGWASLPDAASETDPLQGVVVLNETVPGGTAVPFDRGHTTTHEVGHWAGLLHTFQGGCSEPNDGVADTPQERSGASGCPVGRDSCPLDNGADPITNYMDYSDDLCMTGFTAGQGARARALVAEYRPTLWAGGFGLATVPRGAFDEAFVGLTTAAELRVTNATAAPFTVTGVTGEDILENVLTVGIFQFQTVQGAERGRGITGGESLDGVGFHLIGLLVGKAVALEIEGEPGGGVGVGNEPVVVA